MPTFVVRTITPKRAELINAKYFINEIERALKGNVAKNIIKDLKKPTRQWEHNIDFKAVVSASRNFVTLDVFADGENAWLYNIISEGEETRTIHAKNKPYMTFQPGYRSSTLPGKLWSRRSARSGGWIRKQSVQHSITARDFYGQARDLHVKDTRREIENAIRRAVRR